MRKKNVKDTVGSYSTVPGTVVVQYCVCCNTRKRPKAVMVGTWNIVPFIIPVGPKREGRQVAAS